MICNKKGESMFNQVERYIKKLVKNKKIPYMDVIAYQDGRQIFRWYGGDGREEVTGKEKLFLYSATKPLTAVCALRLCEEGKLSLYDEVEKWLPAYKDVYLIDENGDKKAPKNKMLVLHLITMSAGLTYDFKSYPIQETIKENAGKEDTETIVGAFARKPLVFEPGAQFNYSLCHDVLAAVVEKASGKKFSEYVDEIIFQPLRMRNSSFLASICGHANLYDCIEKGGIEKIEDVKYPTWMVFGKDYESGGAGVTSTVEDYIQFADALACGGEKNGYQLLKTETIKQMYQEHLSSISVNNTFTCIQGDDYGYGLGVRTRIHPTVWGLPKGEFGWDGAAGSYVMVDPVNHISVFIGMHLDSWPRIFIGKHLEIVEKIYTNIVKSKNS